MLLKKWLEEEDISVRKFAKKANVSPSTIHNLLDGMEPKLSTAIKVHRATKQQVTYEEMIDPKLLK
jgi:predicted transcriptional regulator